MEAKRGMLSPDEGQEVEEGVVRKEGVVGWLPRAMASAGPTPGGGTQVPFWAWFWSVCGPQASPNLCSPRLHRELWLALGWGIPRGQRPSQAPLCLPLNVH